MMPGTAGSATHLIPGVYPQIQTIKPKIGGINNLGVGVDSTGVEYVLKRGPPTCVAEFVGAAVCGAIGVPHCRPAIVTYTNLAGKQEHLFGSIVEPSVLKFNMTSILEWNAVVALMVDGAMFTKVLAIDLCVGNDDRHAGNWIVRERDPATGRVHHELLAMDFGGAWPAVAPPYHPRKHPSPHTLNIPRHWPAMGIQYDDALFKATCAKISTLGRSWLSAELDTLIGVWLTQSERDSLCDWWAANWPAQVTEVIFSLETDGDWA